MRTEDVNTILTQLYDAARAATNEASNPQASQKRQRQQAWSFKYPWSSDKASTDSDSAAATLIDNMLQGLGVDPELSQTLRSSIDSMADRTGASADIIKTYLQSLLSEQSEGASLGEASAAWLKAVSDGFTGEAGKQGNSRLDTDHGARAQARAAKRKQQQAEREARRRKK
ncbi:unnamed protein product [Jaminaea pallidilutea]